MSHPQTTWSLCQDTRGKFCNISWKMLATDLAKFVHWMLLLYARGNFCSVMHRISE